MTQEAKNSSCVEYLKECYERVRDGTAGFERLSPILLDLDERIARIESAPKEEIYRVSVIMSDMSVRNFEGDELDMIKDENGTLVISDYRPNRSHSGPIFIAEKGQWIAAEMKVPRAL